MTAPASPRIRELAIVLYQANATASEIRDATGCTPDAVRRWVRNAGIPVRSPNGVREPRAIATALEQCRAERERSLVRAAPSPPTKGYVCADGCTCLLCQLAEPVPLNARRTSPFALRLDLK